MASTEEDKWKVGSTHALSLEKMVAPLVGRIVTLTVEEGRDVTARILSVGPAGAELKVVPNGLRD